LLALVTLSAGLWAPRLGAIELVSVGIHGKAGNGTSGGVAASRDGNTVAFFSDASNLVVNDTNAMRDVFVRDISAATTERVSVSSAGTQSNGPSQTTGGAVAISGDGQIVAFYSSASDLVAGDINGQADIFVRRRATDVTERVSVATDGTQGNGASVSPSISEDGRFVVFQSLASNLVAGDTNNASDIFVRDLVNNTTERACGGVQANRYSFSPAISPDGNFVAFCSAATNLVSGDTNGKLDIFVCNRGTGVIERVSVGPGGVQGDGDSILPAISEDGRIVGFKSLATNLVTDDHDNLVDVFARDHVAGVTERISVSWTGGDPNDFSFPPSVSHDGRFVGFGSFATNLVPGDTNLSSDVFVRDRQIRVTFVADVNNQGQLANNGTPDAPPGVSGDGLRVSFVSLASNLVPNDSNGTSDVFATENPFFCPECCPDGVCPAGEVCVLGKCEVPTPTATATRTPTGTATPTVTKTPTPTPTFKVCETNADCQPGEHCRAGFCKKERGCESFEQCFPREACIIEGFEPCGTDICPVRDCECGGDCNLDGIVFVNEINRAVKILNNVLPLDQCVAADINGDGQVMGNEITLAVINLGEGCAQEGQPLIFAHDRDEVITLTVGSATGAAGEAAAVSIDVSGGLGEVATAQLDLLFDPSMLEISDPSTACRKDGRLTGHVLSAAISDAPPAPAGLQRLRLFVGDLTAPIATFADGRIATCVFRIKPAAADIQVVLAADRLNVGDARGNVFGSRAVSGGVSILVPTATPVPVPTPRPFCPGDCNGDGEVFVNEITVAVRILAGEAPLSDCSAADADADGEVFVTDIARGVISLGRGCPR
jgi:Tol biopolymer transport system component